MVEQYSGTDNLEVMEEAVNYNAFVASLVVRLAQAGDRMLDFGAGTGTFAARVRDAGWTPTCIETDPALADRLREQGFQAFGSLAGVPDASVDLAYTLNVLEHIEDDRAALGDLLRVLRPGGRLGIYVPAFPVLYSAMDRKVGHFRRYRRAELVEKVAGAGLEVERCDFVDSIGFPAALANKYLGRRDGGIDRHALRLYDRVVFPLSRIADRALHRLIGKNLWLVARRPPTS